MAPRRSGFRCPRHILYGAVLAEYEAVLREYEAVLRSAGGKHRRVRGRTRRVRGRTPRVRGRTPKCWRQASESTRPYSESTAPYSESTRPYSEVLAASIGEYEAVLREYGAVLREYEAVLRSAGGKHRRVRGRTPRVRRRTPRVRGAHTSLISNAITADGAHGARASGRGPMERPHVQSRRHVGHRGSHRASALAMAMRAVANESATRRGARAIERLGSTGPSGRGGETPHAVGVGVKDAKPRGRSTSRRRGPRTAQPCPPAAARARECS